jgi:hypothetical protein
MFSEHPAVGDVMLRNDEPRSNFEQQLEQEAERLKQRVKSVPEGKEREMLVRKVRQLDVISYLNGSLSLEPG